MNKMIESILLSLTKSEKILNEELIQNLWSGYGQLTRVTLDNKSVIIKLIQFPNKQDHPRGWNSDLSHKRKVKSYKIEMAWYKDHNQKIQNTYSPQYISSGEFDGTKYLLLEDLKEKDFIPKNSIDWNQVKLCLKWLAYFHAKYLGTSTKGLWEVGTYWHLNTRPDELMALNDENLLKAAPLINEKLNSCQFQTLVHGDAKLANFLFNDNEVSAVDFQYVGGGVGVKDLAYFLSSIYGEDELYQYEEKCLDYYFQELNIALNLFHPTIDESLLEKEWRDLYPYAWCDFYRFLKGWSPNHFKLNTYSEKMKEKVLKCF
jgi:hypothetical protein